MMNDIKQLEQILSLLKESYTSTNSSKLVEISKLLNNISKDLIMYIDILFHGLSLSSFNNEQIPFELHQSLSINLKNKIEERKAELGTEQISEIIKKIFELYFLKETNKNLLKEPLIKTFKDILITLLQLISNEESNVINTNKFIDSLFVILLNAIKKENNDEFIINAKIVIKFIQGFFESKIVNKYNFEKIISDYYVSVLDIIFKNVPQFIDPEKNVFNDEYFLLLVKLIEGMFLNLKSVQKTEDIDNVKYCGLISNLFKKYGKILLELIKIQLPLSENSKKVFVNQNQIISFSLIENEKLCSSINAMKSKCFQYFAFNIEVLSRKTNENKFTTYDIQDQYIIELMAELTKIIIIALQDILSNKEKFLLVKSSKEGIFTSDKSYNNLLYNIFLFLSRYLIRIPIIKEFSSYINYFLLNVLFPLATFEDSEKQFMSEEPDIYINYLDDILYSFKYSNFRTSLCFLIQKIFRYYDESNIIFYYIIEMIMYIFDMNNSNNNDKMKYKIYLNDNYKSVINNFNDEIKIDFCFLIILLLKTQFISFPQILNKFKFFFISNQEKIHQINSSIILIKVCEIYKQYIDCFFNNDKIVSSQEEEIKLKINNTFIENMLNFLFNIILNSTSIQKGNNEISSEALVTKASDTVVSIFDFVKKNYSGNNCPNLDEIKISRLDIIFYEKIRNSFKLLLGLINTYNCNSSLMTIIINIIKDIKINERQDVFNCLNIFTNIFINTVNNKLFENDCDNRVIFINKYFNLINNFLKGENKLNKNEIKLFDDIISPVISLIAEPNKYSFSDEIIYIGECCMKSINDINDLSIKILDNLYLLINTEKTISGYYYTFLSTFLSYININNINRYSSHLNTIMNLIKLAYSFQTSDDYYEYAGDNVLYTLLLTMQILSFDANLLNCDDIKFLVLLNIKYCVLYFNLLNKNENKDDSDIFENNNLDEKIKFVLLANFSIFFVFYADITLKVLVDNFMNIFNGKNEITNFCEFMDILFRKVINPNEHYYPLLGKCYILCICSLFTNNNLCNIIMNDIDKKKLMLKLLFNLVLNHENQSKKINIKLTDSEIKCDFIECEESEENSNKEEENDDDFNNDIKISLKNYEKIIKCDEYKIFNETFLRIKSNNEQLINDIFNQSNKRETSIIYNLLHVRNIRVEYNGKQIEIPRRTLKIKRNKN